MIVPDRSEVFSAPLRLVAVRVPLTLTPVELTITLPPRTERSPDAVTLPLILTLPVPVTSLELRSRFPPSCGDVSSTTLFRPAFDRVSTATKVRFPEPSVFSTVSAAPSAPGRTKVSLEAILSGAFNSTKFVPLLVAS